MKRIGSNIKKKVGELAFIIEVIVVWRVLLTGLVLLVVSLLHAIVIVVTYTYCILASGESEVKKYVICGIIVFSCVVFVLVIWMLRERYLKNQERKRNKNLFSKCSSLKIEVDTLKEELLKSEARRDELEWKLSQKDTTK